MNTKNNDKFFMQQAIGLALKAKGNTSPNPVVGAVIVKNGKVVSSGYHRRCGGDHAEVIALKKANGEDIKGATLYVTLEPCNHWGNTPPCVDSVIESGISEVVIAIKDPNPLTNGRSINKLRSAKLKVRVGVLAEEAAAINEAFIKHVKFGMPFVVAKCAQTLDGKIAAASGHSKWITSSKTRDYTHKLRDEFDAILVGSNTVLKKMARRYKVEDFKMMVQKFRKEIPDITVSTDIIVGFPNESEEDFEKTLEIVKEIKFDVINIARFVPREGTFAYSMQNQILENSKKERSTKLTTLFREISLEKNKKWIGWQGKMIINEKLKDGKFIGRNYAYKPIILLSKNKKLKFGDIIQVKIVDASKFVLKAEIIKN